MLQKSYRLDGTRLMMKLTHVDDTTGVVQRETEISQGERDAELARANDDLAQATRERDGIQNAASETPLPPTGPPGRSERWFVRNGRAYHQEIRRMADGRVHVVRSQDLGHQAAAVAKAEDRRAELEAHRDGVQNAQ